MNVDLGMVELEGDTSPEKMTNLKTNLQNSGLQRMDDKKVSS